MYSGSKGALIFLPHTSFLSPLLEIGRSEGLRALAVRCSWCGHCLRCYDVFTERFCDLNLFVIASVATLGVSFGQQPFLFGSGLACVCSQSVLFLFLKLKGPTVQSAGALPSVRRSTFRSAPTKNSRISEEFCWRLVAVNLVLNVVCHRGRWKRAKGCKPLWESASVCILRKRWKDAAGWMPYAASCCCGSRPSIALVSANSPDR